MSNRARLSLACLCISDQGISQPFSGFSSSGTNLEVLALSWGRSASWRDGCDHLWLPAPQGWESLRLGEPTWEEAFGRCHCGGTGLNVQPRQIWPHWYCETGLFAWAAN